jgi:hypothetical protein
MRKLWHVIWKIINFQSHVSYIKTLLIISLINSNEARMITYRLHKIIPNEVDSL